MQSIPSRRLSIVVPTDPVPTVEADMGSFPTSNFDFDDTLATNLMAYCSANPTVSFTLYYYYTESINFRRPTDSVFIGLAGPDKHLAEILRILQRTPGVLARYSDYIDVSTASAMIHIENGKLYRAEDRANWYQAEVIEKEIAEEPAATEPTLHDNVDPDEEWGTDAASSESSQTPRASVPARFRTARADASLGSIKRTIEGVFGLPEGSVLLCGPDGKPLRNNAKVATLRKRWE